MKNFVLFLTALCMLLSACGILPQQPVPTEESIFTEAATETTAPTEPPHSEFYDPTVSVEDVITYFNEVCLDAEFVSDGDATLLQKWCAPLYYYIDGTPTDEDLLTLNAFADQLNAIEGFPGIYATTDFGEVNMHIFFCSQERMLNIMGDSYTGLDGAVVFWYENDIIYNCNICIRTDLQQQVRNSVIMEELYNGLGPVQDTKLREDSLIFSGYSEPQEMTSMDKLILKLLYHPDMKCGMNAEECAEVIRKLYW